MHLLPRKAVLGHHEEDHDYDQDDAHDYDHGDDYEDDYGDEHSDDHDDDHDNDHGDDHEADHGDEHGDEPAAQADYSSLNSFYRESVFGAQFPNLTEGVCFDILDTMNSTQRRWGSEQFQCGQHFQGSAPLILAG